MRTTYMAKKNEIKRDWYVIDASGFPLGRLASEVARILMGKHKPIFTPHMDTGDFVIVVNAKDVVLTGNKLLQKYYYRHSGYPGGLKKIRYDKLLGSKPEMAFKLAVRRMLPANRLGRAMLKKLKVYAGPQHPHEAQNPVVWTVRPKRVAE
ncbi:MAG: 50S ribosomal protein L13 [Firmicutes bacterium]|nr:50S ribosomal protein L13 [Bacillota bacterium]